MSEPVVSRRKYFARGTSVALFGGSFDPPHDGHRLVSLAALRALNIDHVWWLVSPQNPLKTHQPQEMAHRLAACETLARHPRIHVSDEEARLGTQYAIDTVRRLKAAHDGVHFIWLMGSDSLADYTGGKTGRLSCKKFLSSSIHALAPLSRRYLAKQRNALPTPAWTVRKRPFSKTCRPPHG